MKITISNEFSGRETTVDTSKPLTREKVRAIRRRLCRPECASGDILGARGRQDEPEAYLDFLVRAEAVLVSGNDPWPSPEEARRLERRQMAFELFFGNWQK